MGQLIHILGSRGRKCCGLRSPGSHFWRWQHCSWTRRMTVFRETEWKEPDARGRAVSHFIMTILFPKMMDNRQKEHLTQELLVMRSLLSPSTNQLCDLGAAISLLCAQGSHLSYVDGEPAASSHTGRTPNGVLAGPCTHG